MAKEEPVKVPLKDIIKCLLEKTTCKKCPYIETCLAEAKAKVKEGQEICY